MSAKSSTKMIAKHMPSCTKMSIFVLSTISADILYLCEDAP